jgi:F0F1-type ATP synthase assembly protein I
MAPPNPPNLFIKYSSIVFQMGLVIGLFAWGGQKLDGYFQTKKPWFTIVLSLLGIAGGLYLALKDFIKTKK